MVFAIPIASFFVRLSILVLALFSTLSASAAPLQKSWGVGILSWPEKVQVTDGTGQSFDSSVQVYAPSLHFGARNYHSRDGLLYEGYLFYGKADIQSDSASLTYFQKRVPIYGAGASYGWYYRPEGKQVNIGFTVPVQVRRRSKQKRSFRHRPDARHPLAFNPRHRHQSTSRHIRRQQRRPLDGKSRMDALTGSVS